MTRLTRQEAQARTRAEVLDAAERVFLDRGFQDATVEAIAEEAGYSIGAVYSNFQGKAHLLSAVIGRRSEANAAVVARAIAEGRDLVDKARRIGQLEAQLAEESGEWLLLEWECRIQTLRAAGLRQPLRRGNSPTAANLGEVIAQELERQGLASALPPEQLAVIFMALSNGLNYHRLQFPDDVPDELFPKAFEVVVEGLNPKRHSGAHQTARRSRGKAVR